MDSLFVSHLVDASSTGAEQPSLAAPISTRAHYPKSTYETLVYKMEQSLSTPKSLVEFKKRGEEVKAFEGFKETEPNIHCGFKEVTRFDEQRVEFRAVTPRYIF